MDATEKKRAAARAALDFIEPGTTLGIGTGSTVNCLIEILPEIRDYIDRVVSSSRASTKLLEEQGFEYTDEQVRTWLEIYLRRVPARGNVLDLCCGDGIWARGIKALQPNLDLYGIDISPGGIEKARSSSTIPWR